MDGAQAQLCAQFPGISGLQSVNICQQEVEAQLLQPLLGIISRF